MAKNHPKPSQEFREQIGPFLHKMKGFSKISHQKVHAKFAKNLGRQILENTFSGAKFQGENTNLRLPKKDFALLRLNCVANPQLWCQRMLQKSGLKWLQVA